MAKDKLTDYDPVASNNQDLGGISVAEGMLPSGVNNAIREQMSHLADFAAGNSGVDVLKLQDNTDTNSIKLQAPASVTADTTFTLPDGDGSADQVLKTDGSGQLDWVAQTAVTPNPSLIINGNMACSQRGTQTNQTSAYTACDRWNFIESGSTVITTSQSTDTPASQGFANSLKVNVTTDSGTPSASHYAIIRQKLEGQDLQHLLYGTSSAKKITLSFWVKSPKTGKQYVELYHTDAAYHNQQSYTIAAADTWQYVSLTYNGYETTAFDNDNGNSLMIQYWLMAGSDYTSGTATENTWHNTNANRFSGLVNVVDNTANNWHITGVKLEVGSTATPFDHSRSFSEELALCHRYYYSIQGATGQSPEYFGYAYGGTSHVIFVPFLTQMRASPSLSTAGTITGRNSTNTADSSISVEANVSCRDSASIVVRNLTATQGTPSRIELGATGQLNFSAEL